MRNPLYYIGVFCTVLVLLFVASILILSVLSVPGTIDRLRRENERIAHEAVKAIVRAQDLYRQEFGEYAQDIEFLENHSADMAELKGIQLGHGYTYEMTASSDSFQGSARPLSEITGSKSFYCDQSGKIVVESLDK